MPELPADHDDRLAEQVLLVARVEKTRVALVMVPPVPWGC